MENKINIFEINPKSQAIIAHYNSDAALDSTFGKKTKVAKTIEESSKTEIFFSVDGIKSNNFFRFNDILLGGSCVILTDKTKSEVNDLIKWVPAIMAMAELTCQSFLAETIMKTEGFRTERVNSLSFNVFCND